MALVDANAGIDSCIGGRLRWSGPGLLRYHERPMNEFVFEDRPSSAVPRRSRSNLPWILAASTVVLAAAAGGWALLKPRATLTLAPIAPQTVREGETLSIPLNITATGLKKGDWTGGIVSGPTGSRVDRNGNFVWTPAEDQGPSEHSVTVAVQAKGTRAVQAQATFPITVQEVNQAPAIAEVQDAQAEAGMVLEIPLLATDADLPPQPLSFQLKSGPEAASVDPKSGRFRWSIPASARGTHAVEILVTDTDRAVATARFSVEILPGRSPLQQLMAALKDAEVSVESVERKPPAGFQGRAQAFDVDPGRLMALEYDSAVAARKDVSQIDETGQTLFGQPVRWELGARLFHREAAIVIYEGSSQRVLDAIEGIFGEAFVVAEAMRPEPMPTAPAELTVPEKLLRAIVELHQKQNLTGKKDYPGIRRVFAEFLEQQNRELLDSLSAGEGQAFRAWLDEHTEFKEEFLIALAPEDDLAGAWKILEALHRKSPARLAEYGALAIALAVTWDTEGHIDHYADHQRRTHSNMPGDLLGAAENFEYFVDAASIMQGRAQFLPWEFLVYLVNHKTPRSEREWAASNYVPRRAMYGKCYADVPYDYEMLRTESRVCKLQGKDYSLPNLRQFGGVCAMQADFAARVGKSIGVPAEYVAGEAAGGELHAWVMWVEIKQVSRTGISFVLESHGRYRGDKFYVGTLRDPQTGRQITDRELELRLQAVGLNPIAFRHARLVMQAYPQLRDHLKLTPVQELAMLSEVMDLCPGNESVWQQVASLAREGRIGVDSHRHMTAMFDRLFRTFSAFPDFTWKVFDDLVQYQKNARQRNKYYERLVQMYEAAGRPDLACEARLTLSNYLLEEGLTKEVIEGLAFTIKKFPDEGRYVPRLLDKLEQVCQSVRGADQQLLRFYLEFIPLVPQKRGDVPSPYCMRMLERAIDKFMAAGQTQQAQVFANQLAVLRATE